MGTSPGNYSETFDVGSRTFFVYVAAEARPYYLAVAAYSAGPRVGPLSPPVSATPHSSVSAPLPPGITDARSFYGYVWGSGGTVTSTRLAPLNDGARSLRDTGFSIASPPVVCGDISMDCYTIRRIARSRAAITSLAASADGGVFFIEDGQRVAVIASNMAQPWPVLMARAEIRFSQVAVDPLFSTSGTLYVGETETRSDGSREFMIARYHMVGNQAWERSVIVSLPLRVPVAEPVFAVNGGQLYVALAEDELTPYSSMVLRFNDDGGVPGDQHGSPVFATGYWSPSAIVFDDQASRLWLAGVDDRGQASLSSLAESTSLLATRAVSLATSDARHGSRALFVASDTGGFGRALVPANGSLSSTEQLTVGSGLVRSLAAGSSGELFVAVEEPSVAGSTFSILRLTAVP